MKIYSTLRTLLIFCIGIFVSVTAGIPEINFSGLSKILISGQYNGISIYNGAPGQKEILDNASDSLIMQSQNSTFQLVGATSNNGTINTLCILPRSNDEKDVYIGGSFSAIGDITVNNIARYDPSTRKFSPLIKGLDGPVYSLYCDTTNSIVYVGGSFVAPMDPTASNINATDFAGSVAVWRNETWKPLPFKGFNGPVYTIAYNEPNNTVYFGGQFDATGDGNFGEISNTQSINIQNAVVTGGNSADRVEFGDPSVIICSADPDGSGTTWLMRDNIPGFWRAEFSDKITPSMIGIKNTKFEGRGTKAFRLIATADMSVITLSYVNPMNGFTETCTDSCPLSPDNVDYQMFTFVNQPELIGIEIDILEWYGAGGGFHGIKLFQSDVTVRAVNDIKPSCTVNQLQPKVTVEGTWTPKLISGIWKNVLTTGELATAKAILQPYIPQAGNYRVSMITPSCIPIDCSKTTSIDVTINPAPGQTFGPITISQNNPTLNDRVDVLFSGFIVATTTTFQPTVVIKSTTVTAPAGAIILVDSIKFEKMYNGIPLRGLFQYWPPSNSNSPALWNGFNGVLAPLSTVHKIKVLSQSSIVIAGKFNNITFFNIVEYDGTLFKPFPRGGLNGRVNTLEKVNDNLFIGGLFNNNVLEPATIGMNNIAKLSLTERQWFPIDGGVNGEVEIITLLNNNQGTQQVHVSGKFNTVITPQANAKGIIFGNIEFGYAIWDDNFSNWITSGFVDGSLSDILVSEKLAPLTFYAGRISSAQSITAFGGSLLTSSGISALPLYPQALNGNIPETIINTGSLWNDNVIIGGKFSLGDNITNIAITRDGFLNNLGNDVIVEEVKSLIVIDELLYIGSANNNFNPFIIYDLNKRIMINVSPQLTAGDNNVKVNTIKRHTRTPEILVGGKFDKAGSLICKAICVWDSNLKQWKTLGINDNLSGEILSMDLIGKNSDILVVAGNLTLNGTPVYLLKYDFNKSNWEEMRGIGNSRLPGPAVVVYNDFIIDGQFFVSGYSEEGSVYLYKWTDNNFINIGQDILPGSRIEALSLLPSNNEHESVNYLDIGWLLLVSGSLNLNSIGTVSAALYDGKNTYPYILASQPSGVPGDIFSIFTIIDFNLLNNNHLPIPVVITISTVIALSFVFLIFASGMSYRYFKRKRQARELTTIGPRDSIKTPIRNSELMATINAATAIIGQQNNNRYSMASSNNLRNSAFGSNVDIKSLDEVAVSGLVGSEAIGQNHNQTSTLQNNPPTSMGEQNSESNDLNLTKGLDKAIATEQISSTAPRSSTQLHPVIITPAGEDASTGQVWLNGEQAFAYRARYPFVAREEGELGFNAGDTIFVTDTSDEVWWLGWKRQDGTDEFVRGVFPSNYVANEMNPGKILSSES